MGIIQVNTPEGLVDVKISGTDPTIQEQQRIINRFFPASPQAGQPFQAPTIQEAASKFAQQDDPNFDYKTGADSGLRALLSFGESAEDKEAILTSLVGEGGFTRDKAGRLALTPEGQRARGAEAAERNLIIEDEGFSLGDIADLAGIVPETVGSIAGAITTFPFLFGAPGAAAGAAIGQLLEEGVESSLGVQKQSASEVAKDVATEAALAGTFELAGGLVFKAASGLIGGAGSLARRADTPVGEAQLEDIIRLEKLAERGAIGSAEAAGAPGLIAYRQKFGENVLKDQSRMQNNLNIMIDDANRLRGEYGAMASAQAGDVFEDVTSNNYKNLKKAEIEATEAANKALRESVNILERSAIEGLDVNRELLNKVSDEFGSSLLLVQNKFNNVDNLLNQIEIPGLGTGRTSEIIPTANIKAKIDSIEEALGGNIATFGPATERAAAYIRGLPENASFRQIAEGRKMMNDALFREASSQAERDFADEFFALRAMLDEATTGRELSEIATDTMTPKQRAIFEEAAEERKKAMDFYKETMQKWEDVERFGIIQDLRTMLKRDGKFDVDQFTNKLVKENSPERLRTIYTALGEEAAEPFRAALARDYLEKAINATGVSEYGDFTKGTFSGRAFASRINKLGTTGKELFGENWDEVRRLSEALEMAGPDKIDRQLLQKIMTVNSNAAPTDILRQLVEAKEAVAQADAIKVVKQFNEGTLTPEMAVKRMTSKDTNEAELDKLIKFFENDPQAKEALKGALIDDILSTVDTSLFDNAQNPEVLLKTINAYKAKGNVLEKVLGREGALALEELAKDIKILGDVSKEGSVAAPTYTMNPFKKFTDILQFKILNQAGKNPEVYKKLLRAKKAQLEGTAEAANDRVIQQLESSASKVLSGARVAATGFRQGVVVPTISSGVNINRDRPTMQAPQLIDPNKSSSLSSVQPVVPVTPGPAQFYGIPQQASQPSIRQQARQNPGIAAALGIQGATAGLI